MQLRLHAGNQLDLWLHEDGLGGSRSATKFIPGWVFQLSREDAALFLNRLWSTDGHVKQNGPSKYSVEYCSISERLVRDVQALLWKFGIPSKIRKNWPSIYKRRGEKKFAFMLRVESKAGVHEFITNIGALGKSENVAVPTAAGNNNRDTFPLEINELVRAIVASNPRPRSGRAAKNGSLRSAGLRETLKYPLTRDKLKTYLEFFSEDAAYDWSLVQLLAAHLDTDVYWDEVVSIESIGEQECVDFEVDGHHNFVADSYVTHNSTLLGNLILAYSCIITAYKTLYVSPSATQTKTFSSDRIKEPIETSEVLKAFTTTMLSMNVFEKQFVNRSKITLRYAFLNADRTRGIPAHRLALDEIQDILADNIPVIEQCTAHAPEELKSFVYAGTPKGLDNSIEYYRSGVSKSGRSMSTQGEWVVPCDRHGGEGGRYWNVLGEKNIGNKGLICEKCGEAINPMHPDAQWAEMVAGGIFESYRIPQLMVPWRSWEEILLDYGRYPRDKFHNEVLGLSYDSGMRPLNVGQIQSCCNSSVTMHPEVLENTRKKFLSSQVFAGVDWGCHDEATRILTEDGFKYFKDLSDTDLVAQWDPDTRAMTFVKPKVRTIRDWDKPLLHFETKGGLDIMVTDTHRMRVGTSQGQKWVTEPADELAQRGGNVHFVGHVDWFAEDRDEFVLPGLPASSGYAGSDPRVFRMDDWLELLGYLVTEGGLCFSGNRPSCLKMSQRATVNQVTYGKIQAALNRCEIPHTPFPNTKTGDVNWTIYGKQFWKWYQDNVGVESSEKRLPRQFLNVSKRQLKILFDALVAGDGTTDGREGCESGAFYSTSKGLCEDFQEICIRLGLRCTVRLHKQAEGNRKTRWRASWSRGRDYQFNKPSSSVKYVPYTGKVYCCAVPSGYIVTERNGCVSYQGNTGENSYTVACLGTYVGNRFRIFWIHRFTGEDTDPQIQVKKLVQIFRAFNVRIIGSDYGGGFASNNVLLREFGQARVQRFQYQGKVRKKVFMNPQLQRWLVHRTEVMSDLFAAIKRKQLEFPRWEEFREPFAQDMLNIFSEYNETLRMIQYQHRPDRPDDSFHTILYCFLASMILHPRPDIIVPKREFEEQGPTGSTYSGPLWQG